MFHHDQTKTVGKGAARRIDDRIPAEYAEAFRDVEDNVVGFPEPPQTVQEPDLTEILAAVSAVPSNPSFRLRLLEDRIRRQWAVLHDLVREHTELVQAGVGSVAQPSQGRRRPRGLVPGPDLRAVG